MSCDSDIEGKRLLASVTQGKNFELPDIDVTDPKWDLPPELLEEINKVSAPLTLDALTTARIDGTGSLDVILKSLKLQLKEEYSSGRISGAEYTKAFIALVTSGLEAGLQFVLQKETARWQALTAQIQAVTAKMGLETAKAQYVAAKGAALTAEAQYGLLVLKMATEDATYCVQQEQKEVARAQTMDTRTSGESIKGTVGKQKDLHSQQITSYQRSSELNAVQVLKDAWIAHKSIDEGIDTPAAFNATAISTAIQTMLTNNNLS